MIDYNVTTCAFINCIEINCTVINYTTCIIGVAKQRRCTQRKRYRLCMLHKVAAHNVCIQNVKVSKRELHITYTVTKCTVSQWTLHNRYRTFCNSIRFVTLYSTCHLLFKKLYILELLRCVEPRFVTLRHVTFTLCCFTLCSNIV